MARNRGNNGADNNTSEETQEVTETPESTEGENVSPENSEDNTSPENVGEENNSENESEESNSEGGETTPEEDKLTPEQFYALSVAEQIATRKEKNIPTSEIPLSNEEKGERFNELPAPFQKLVTTILGEIEEHNKNVDVVRSADPEKALQLKHEKRDANPWQNEILHNLNVEREKVMAEYERLTKLADEKTTELMADEIRTPEQIEAARALVSDSSKNLSGRKKFLSDYETQMAEVGLSYPGQLTDLLPEIKNLKGVKTGLPSGGRIAPAGTTAPRVQLDEFYIQSESTGEWKLIEKNGKSNAGMVAKALTDQLHGRGAISSTEVTTSFYDGYNALYNTSLGYNDSKDVKPGSHEFEVTFHIPAKVDPNGREVSPAKVKTWKLRGVKNAS